MSSSSDAASIAYSVVVAGRVAVSAELVYAIATTAGSPGLSAPSGLPAPWLPVAKAIRKLPSDLRRGFPAGVRTLKVRVTDDAGARTATSARVRIGG